MATQLDIAKKVGVSRSLVSHALRSRTDLGIRRQTIDKILETAKELGYSIPTATSKSIQNNLVCVTLGGGKVGGFNNPFYGRVLHGVDEVLKANHFHMLLADIPETEGSTHAAPYVVSQRCVRGMMHLGQMDESAIQEIDKCHIPLSIAWGWTESDKADCVFCDGRKVAQVAMEYLYEQGHRHIVHLAGPDLSIYSKAVKEGFIESLRAKGYEHPESAIVQFPEEFKNVIDREAGQKMTRQFLEERSRRFEKTTCLFATCDAVAMGILDVLLNQGIKVPQELSVLSNGNIPGSEHTLPALTTVSVPREEIGRVATERLISRLQNSSQSPQHIYLPVKQVIRRNTVAKLHG